MPSYFIYNVMFSDAQLAHALLMAAYTYPTDRESNLDGLTERCLTELAALGDVMGFIQVLLL